MVGRGKHPKRTGRAATGRGKGGRDGGGRGGTARPAASRGPRPNTADGETERRILDAARRVFVRRGSAGARMQEIAAEAGVNPALLHYYFRSKDALALAVFREAAGKLFGGVLTILASDAPLEARIEHAVHHYIDTLRQAPFLPGYVIAELNFDPGRMAALAVGLTAAEERSGHARAAVLAAVDDELRARAAGGEFRPIAVGQFLVNLASLCVFPFAARPMLQAVLGLDASAWDDFLDARRAELPRLILNSLKR